MSRRTVFEMMSTLLLICILTLAFNVKLISSDSPVTQQHGPRHSPGLTFHFYGSSEVAYAALKAGEVDLIQHHPLTADEIADVIGDPSLLLASYVENMMWEYDFNHNYTIQDYPSIRNPMTDLSFRQAIACLINKTYIIHQIYEDRGKRIDVPVAALQTENWANASVISWDWNHNGAIEPDERNYPYEYNEIQAEEYLNNNGWIDYDGDGVRNYPLDWPGVQGNIGVRDEPNMAPLKVYVRIEDERLHAGRYLCDQLTTHNIPVNKTEGDSILIFPIVMDDRNYHIYTGGWSLGRYPLQLHSLYHTDYWYPGGPNYVHGFNWDGDPQFPEIDNATEDIARAINAQNFKDAMTACRKATGIMATRVLNIPICSPVNYIAYSKYLIGIVNMDGYGPENQYTYLNAYKTDNPETYEDESQQSIRVGTCASPRQLNPLYSMWYYDWAVLDRIFEYGINTQPYNLGIDQPWIFQDWKVECIYSDELDKNMTKVTYWIRKDVQWVNATTGNIVRNFTAHDVEFTIWYMYTFDDARNWGNVRDVIKTEVVNDYKIEVIYNNFNFWSYWSLWQWGYNLPLLPKTEYEIRFCKQWMHQITVAGNGGAGNKLVFDADDPATDFVNESQVVQMVSADIDGTPLTQYVNYEIEATGADGYCHSKIHFLADIPDGTLTLTYWTPSKDPHGPFLCNESWQKSLSPTIGPYRMISITPGVGGYLDMVCNEHYFLETPPLGEIDWRWYWQGTTKPRSGYYRVDIFDVVRATAAYCTRGDGEPDPQWFPGADLDRADLGCIGIYDVVTVTGRYGKRYGMPPEYYTQVTAEIGEEG